MPHRRSAASIAIALVALPAFAPAAPAVSVPAPTTNVRFRAFTPGGGLLGLRISQSVRGHCFAGSIGLPRPDAWRCIVGNGILDPCLESPKGARASLVCIDFRGRGVLLHLTSPLPRKLGNRPERSFFAWKLVLSDGDVCQRFTGTAAGVVQGAGLVYGCRSGGTTTDANRTRPAWTVRYLAKGRDPLTVKRLASLRLLTVVRAIG
jgi:hypothetical protein